MKRASALPRKRSTRRVVTLLLLTAILAVLAASGAASAGTTPRPTKKVKVSIKDFYYDPTPVTVHIGERITWVNTGQNYHSATARNGSFDTNPFAPGESRSVRFNKVGTFEYFCEVHPFMHGTVKVTN